jgi:hypothetical protein
MVFREVALFHALGAEIAAQGEVGFLRDLDVPAHGFFHMTPLYRLYMYTGYTG